MAKVTISFVANREIREQLERESKEQGRSVSEVIRRHIISAPEVISLCCDWPTILLDGVRYCFKCGGKVAPVEVE